MVTVIEVLEAFGTGTGHTKGDILPTNRNLTESKLAVTLVAVLPTLIRFFRKRAAISYLVRFVRGPRWFDRCFRDIGWL